MAFHPTPFDAVPPRGVVESAPQVAFLDRLLVRGRPAAFLPVVDPLGDAFADVLAVGEQLDLARSLQGGERLDHGGQFHPVVRGGGRTPVQLFAVRSAGQDDTPTAGTVRVPLAGPVRVDHHARQRPTRRLDGLLHGRLGLAAVGDVGFYHERGAAGL